MTTRVRSTGRWLASSASAIALTAAAALPAAANVINDEAGLDAAEEFAANNRFNGVAMMYALTPNGFVGFCTGQLINPRTILSAAHCVNDFSSEVLSGDVGAFGQVIWGFGPDTTDLRGDLFNLFLGDQTGFTSQFARSTDVIVHPSSEASLGGIPFPGADVFMSALDQPIADLPTYAMLFSPVEVGTHVLNAGYGTAGLGSTGANLGIDGKRRAGENILGFIGSQIEFLAGAFQTSAFFGGPQNEQTLYWTDFDNPNADPDACARQVGTPFPEDLICTGGTLTAIGPGGEFVAPSPDINWFPGDTALPLEQGTAGGDSGSAIFADELSPDELLILGVLSGGFPFSSPLGNSDYGDVSYYNPLFAFFEFIVENNPYKYVSATAGDGNWSDPTHWVQDLDPAYRIIDANGAIVNGIPDGTEPGVGATEPNGGVVFDTDPADFTPRGTASDIDALAQDNAAGVRLTDGSADPVTSTDDLAMSRPGVDDSLLSFAAGAENASVGFGPSSIVTSSPLLGPGSTGFVPNNTDGSPGIAFVNPAQYFDVTLRNAGTTTVDLDVEIDRLTISNNGARLVVGDSWAMEVLIDATINAGVLDVDGLFGTREILNVGGMVSGDGLLGAQTLFNIAGIIAPGDAGQVGTLEAIADVVFSSGGMFMVDLSSTGSDLLSVTGDREVIPGNGSTSFGVNGDVSLGGLLGLGLVGGYQPQDGDTRTILTTTGQIIGNFSAVSDLPGVLFARSIVTNDASGGFVTLEIDAASFFTELPADATPNQAAIAALLDGARDNAPADFADIFSEVDLLSGNALAGAFNLLTPASAFSAPNIALGQAGQFGGLMFNRGDSLRAGASGVATFSANSNAVQVASADPMHAFHAVAGATDDGGAGAPTAAYVGRGIGVYASIGFDFGDSDTALPQLDDEFDGQSFFIGVDRAVSPNLTIGVSGFYQDVDGDFARDPAGALSQLGSAVNVAAGLGGTEMSGFTGAVYANYDTPYGFWDGYVGLGQRDIDTSRFSPLAGGFTAVGATEADQVVAGLRYGATMALGAENTFVPSTGLRYASYDIAGYTETGGLGAFTFADRTLETMLVDAGGTVYFNGAKENARVRPMVGGAVVYDLDGARDRVSASFVSNPATTVELFGPDRDKLWFDAEAGVALVLAPNATASFTVNRTFDRNDLTYGSANVSLSLKW